MTPEPHHILLVEDDDAHIILIERAFGMDIAKTRLTVARSLREARNQIEQEQPDLIITDLLLPDGRGVQLLPPDSQQRRCPVVVMTSHGDEQVAVEAIKAGALDYVVKSEITFQDMPHIAQRALREWQLLIERRRAEEELKKSREFLNNILNALDDPVFVKDEKRRWVALNDKACAMFGRTREELIGKSDADIFPREKAVQFQKNDDQVFQTGQSTVNEEEILSQGKTITISTKQSLFIDSVSGKKFIAGSIRDITERKIAELDLQATNKQLRDSQIQLQAANEQLAASQHQLQDQNKFLNEVFESFDHPFYVIDADTYQVVMANSRAQFGPLDDDSRCYSLTHSCNQPCCQKEHPCPLQDIKKTCKACTVEHIHYNSEGKPRDVEVHAYPIIDENGRITQMIEYFLDITERKSAEKKLIQYQDQLRSLASQLSLVEERERQRIATQLHDRIGQNLIFSKMNLDALRVSCDSPQIAQNLGEISTMIGQAVQDTRSLTFDLGSPILYELGLEAALAELLTEQFRNNPGIRTQFKDDGSKKPLEDDIRILLYQVCRELLVNIVKHAEAENVTVAIGTKGENIRIVVNDDGKGFDAVQENRPWSKNDGFGLFSIRERLGCLGGKMDIDTKPGHGTRVIVTAPLKKMAAAVEGDKK